MNCPSCHAANEDAAESCFECGKSLFSLTKGSVLSGRYEILRLLGKGGMGMVYKAQDRELDEMVAVKVLRSDIAADPDVGRRFRSEIRLARKVRHKNVCAIHEYGQDGHLRFIVMEFVEGVDLRHVLRELGTGLEAQDAFEVAIQVARGLQAVHEVGIVHRDLKTPNIMRDRSGQVRLMDFGIAKSFETEVSTGATRTGQIVGTPEYMSPEQVRAEKLDARSDIYSLGIVCYELFTGDVPFRADTPIQTLFMHLQQQTPLEASRGIPPSAIPVLARALEKDREDRYGSAAEMADALEKARGQRPARVPRVSGAAVPFEDEFVGTELMASPTPTPTPARLPTPVPKSQYATPGSRQTPAPKTPPPQPSPEPARRVQTPAPMDQPTVTAPTPPPIPSPVRPPTVPRPQHAAAPLPRHRPAEPPSTFKIVAIVVGGGLLVAALAVGGFVLWWQGSAPPSPPITLARNPDPPASVPATQAPQPTTAPVSSEPAAPSTTTEPPAPSTTLRPSPLAPRVTPPPTTRPAPTPEPLPPATQPLPTLVMVPPATTVMPATTLPLATGSLQLDVDAVQDSYGKDAADALYLQIKIEGGPTRTASIAFAGKTPFARSRRREQVSLAGVPVGKRRITVTACPRQSMDRDLAEGSTEVSIESGVNRLYVHLRYMGPGDRDVRFR